MTLNRHTGITVQPLFPALPPATRFQGSKVPWTITMLSWSIKKKPQKGWLGVTHFLQVRNSQAGNSESLGDGSQRSAKWHVSPEILWLLDPGLSCLKKDSREKQQLPTGSFSSVTPQTTSCTKVLEIPFHGHGVGELRSARENSGKRNMTLHHTQERESKDGCRLPVTTLRGRRATWAAEKNLTWPISTWRSFGSMWNPTRTVPIAGLQPKCPTLLQGIFKWVFKKTYLACQIKKKKKPILGN